MKGDLNAEASNQKHVALICLSAYSYRPRRGERGTFLKWF